MSPILTINTLFFMTRPFLAGGCMLRLQWRTSIASSWERIPTFQRSSLSWKAKCCLFLPGPWAFCLMQTRASWLWLPGRWDENNVSSSPSGTAKSDSEYISIHNKFSNTLGKRQEIIRLLFKSCQRAQWHPALLSVCQQEASPRGCESHV